MPTSTPTENSFPAATPGPNGTTPMNATALTRTDSLPSRTCIGWAPNPPGSTAFPAPGAWTMTPSAWCWGQAKACSGTAGN